MCFCFGFHEAPNVSKIERVEANFVVHRGFRRVNFFGKTYGMERSISISELSAENGV